MLAAIVTVRDTALGQRVDRGSDAEPTVIRIAELRHDLSRPLREMIRRSRFTPSASPSPHALLQAPTSNLELAVTFPGNSTDDPAADSYATDASGAVGPNHFVEIVNFSLITIYDKSGTLVHGPFAAADFWDDFSLPGGIAPCRGNWADAIVLYDRRADQWLVTRGSPQNADETVTPRNWYQCFAISQTGDPTGEYYRYAYLMDANEIPDFEKFGIWPDAYYMTADRDKIFGGKGNLIAAFERDKMLAGQDARALLYKIDNGGKRAGMLPADWDGHRAPPAGAPNYLIKTLDTNLGWPSYGIEVWSVHTDWAGDTFQVTRDATLSPAAFNSALCALDQNCIPQKDTTQKLDPLAGGRPSFRLTYRNFSDHETLAFAQTVDAGNPANHAGIRWYELRKTAGQWSIHQQATFAPDADHRWLGSLAMDEAGNMAIGYNVSGGVYPTLRVGGRRVSDPLNTMTEEFTLAAGLGAQTGAVFWGDYSQTTLDPVDDCTFWHVGSFQPVTKSKNSWATQIGAFRFADCRADLAVTKSRSPGGQVDAGTTVTYTATVTNNGPRYAGTVGMIDTMPSQTEFVSLTAPDGWNCFKQPDVGDSGAILCEKPAVAVDETATFTAKVKVACSVPNGTVVTSNAGASAATPPDDDSTNNLQSALFTVSNPAPVVTAAVGTSMLPQNNHEMINVGLSASATDGGCAAPSVAVHVFANENDEAPTALREVFSPDALTIAAGTLRLRQERANDGQGRVYLIVATASDAAGGSGFATATVVVPKSSSAANIATVNGLAAAAKSYADSHGGTPPPGYFIIGDGPVIGPKQ
jgi:uncharacterized repeat protein (TIGR01451 family)